LARGAVISTPNINVHVGCEVWGVLNVTPDSFSDGGLHDESDTALARAKRMLVEGADVIDVGGESTRPKGTYGEGYRHVDVQEELLRVLPIVSKLVSSGVRVSIDTVKAEVAAACLSKGAAIVNDVSCGASDSLLQAVATYDAELVLMHNRNHGEVTDENSRYDDVVEDVRSELLAAVSRALRAGVHKERIWLDPGIGFAKNPEQCAALLGSLSRLVDTGHRVLVGSSRKSFIASLAPNADGEKPSTSERMGGTAATVALAIQQGARAIRVHDVAMMRQAALIALALRGEVGGVA
jgi:dihydropteroate synthase